MTMGIFFWVKKVVPYLIVAADGSGDYNDIQAAIDALPADGGSIFIKCGTYTITSTININKDNIAISGAGKCTKIITTSNIPMISCANHAYFTIKNLWIYGAGGSGVSTNSGIVFIALILMSMNFSIPKSAPKPASVTVYSLVFDA